MYNRSLSQAPPMPGCKCMDENGSAAMLATKRLAGVTQQMNLRIALHAGDKACKQGDHSGFETQGRHH